MSFYRSKSQTERVEDGQEKSKKALRYCKRKSIGRYYLSFLRKVSPEVIELFLAHFSGWSLRDLRKIFERCFARCDRLLIFISFFPSSPRVTLVFVDRLRSTKEKARKKEKQQDSSSLFCFFAKRKRNTSENSRARERKKIEGRKKEAFLFAGKVKRGKKKKEKKAPSTLSLSSIDILRAVSFSLRIYVHRINARGLC